MKLLANENFPANSVKYLQKKGFDIRSIGIDFPSISDKDVMSIAMDQNRTILTFDRDYGELIFKHNYRPDFGVIYLRLKSYKSEEPGEIIEQLISDSNFNPARSLTVLDRETIRQKKY